MEYLKFSYIIFIISTIIIRDILSLQVSVTSNPIGILGNNPVALVCTYDIESNDFVTTIAWQKKQKANYDSDDNIGTLYSPTFNRSASFALTTVPGNDLSTRAELENPTTNSLTAVLRINEVECGDEAEYRCLISYVGGSGTTEAHAVTTMTVKGKGAKPDSVPTMFPSSNIAENTEVEFTCTGNVGKPAGNIIWHKFKVNNLQDQKQIPVYNSTEQVVDGTCTFNKTSKMRLTFTRDDDMLVIRCTVVPELPSGNALFEQTEQIRVYYGVDKPVLSRVPTTSNIMAGNRVTMSCNSKGHPTPSYTWYNPKNEVVGYEATYVIPNAQITDSGEYTCVASNSFPFNGQTFNDSSSFVISIVLTTQAPTTTTSTTPSPSAGPTDKPTQSPQGGGDGGLDQGALIGIIVAVVVIVIVVAIVLLIFCLRRRGQRNEIDEPPEKPRNNQDLSFVNRPDIVNNDPYNKKLSPFNNQFSSPNKEQEMSYNFDDRPRSRKPIQLFDPGMQDSFNNDVMMPSV